MKGPVMPNSSKPRILNVDDNAAGRYISSRILQQNGFDVMEAATGREALRLADGLPDLILLDVSLPDIDGFEVCKQIKTNPRTATIPIVHLSAAHVAGTDRVMGLEYGADGYLTQPVEPLVLVATIKAFLRTKAAEDALRESQTRIRKKLDTILLPEGDIGTLELADVIDIVAFQKILDGFSRITHFAMGVTDLHGNILVSAGWQDICAKFHRVHPLTCRLCDKSNATRTTGLKQGTFTAFKCTNHMWDMVTPVVVGGIHLGSLLLGQFFFEDEPLDYDVFRTQASECGFDEKEYLAALDRVPRFSREEVDVAMTFCIQLTALVSTLSYGNIKLARTLGERERAEERVKGQLEELQRWHDVMLDREDRVQELKREVNELCRRLGETTRYPSQDVDAPAAEAGRLTL